MADAVLYEGYVLYPYRASSRKNQARFQWGVLTPRAFSEAEGSERWAMRTECLIAPGPSPAVSVRVRFLRAQRRRIEGARPVGFEAVDHLDVDGTRHVDWDEAIEETVDVSPLPLLPGGPFGWVKTFSFDGGREFEELRAADGTVVGRFVRHREPVSGLVRIAISRPDPESSYVKVAVTVENTTGWNRRDVHRDEVMPLSLISVHTMLAVDDGRFVSLLDPPDDAVRVAQACRSDGAYPVLIGDDDLVVLSSPIILYDHPEVAPQSPGDLYDSLEIDEILALRVMTLTDGEKSEARGTDPRVGRHHRPVRRHVRRHALGPARADDAGPLPDRSPGRRRGARTGSGHSRPSGAPTSPGGTPRWTRRSTLGPSRCGSPASRSRRAPRCGWRRRTGPMPRTSSCRAWPPPWPACSPTSMVISTWP